MTQCRARCPYLAAAVRDNQDENGVVIGTEHEPGKVEAARANSEAAGLSRYVDLRVGDLRQTLRDVGGPVDFMLVDIWEVGLPAPELVSPMLRPGRSWLVTTPRLTAYPGEAPYRFTGGTINRVAVDVSGEPFVDMEREAAAMLSRE